MVQRNESSQLIPVTEKHFPIYLKDILITGEKSRVFVQMIDRSKLLIQPNTRLFIENLKLVKISMGNIILGIIR